MVLRGWVFLVSEVPLYPLSECYEHVNRAGLVGIVSAAGEASESLWLGWGRGASGWGGGRASQDVSATEAPQGMDMAGCESGVLGVLGCARRG